jgi:alpha-glucosidase (family GH31 glycosyl hydrolase)
MGDDLQVYEGGKTYTIDAPLDEIPVFQMIQG